MRYPIEPRRSLLPSARARGNFRNQRGIVLVIVLSVIVMLAMLIVTMLVMARNEIKTTNQYVNALDARVAATAALRIVQSQIRQATITGLVDPEGGEKRHAWASQPGAIRVWDDEGALTNIYKLYSSTAMIVDNVNSLDGDLPTNWKDNPNDFVDLNEPVYRNKKPGLPPQWVYPIANPNSLDKSNTDYYVEGFFSSRDSTATSEDEPDDRLAMPTRWLYINKSGEIENAPTSGSVLRLAFWTDDESCKINVNTASATDAKSYTDIPRVNSKDERYNIAMMQPAQNEFNRYPGHPATISLSSVFPSIVATDTTGIQRIIEASPRYKWGGSQNATKDIWSRNTDTLRDGKAKKNRFYASMDEYLYSSTSTPRNTQLGLTPDVLETRRFFLTANSRSSDLNLFGQPRVAIWPISSHINGSAAERDKYCTPFDELIAFCSTLQIGDGSSRQYFFVRENSQSMTDDWTSSRCARNDGIFQYLQSLTSQKIPGFDTKGNTFEDKYDKVDGGVAGERDQILTEIFDYIRTTNLNETYSMGFSSTNTKAVDSYTTPVTKGEYLAQNGKDFPGAGVVMPIVISKYGTRGAGRVPIISELGAWLIQMYGYKYSKLVTLANGKQQLQWFIDWTKPPNGPEYQGGLVMETFTPTQGFMPWLSQDFTVRVASGTGGKPKVTITGTAGNTDYDFIPTDVVIDPLIANGGISVSKAPMIGGSDGFVWPYGIATQNYIKVPIILKKSNVMNQFDTTGTYQQRIASESEYKAIPLTKYSSGTYTPLPNIPVTGGDLSLELSMFNVKYQTYNVTIPTIDLPIPDPINVENYRPSERNPKSTMLVVYARQGYAFRTGAGGVAYDEEDNTNQETDVRPLPEDVVRTIGIHDGDYRIAAYTGTVGPGFFQDPAALWTGKNGNDPKTVGLRGHINGAYFYTKNGEYIPGLDYYEKRGKEGANDTMYPTTRPKYPYYNRDGSALRKGLIDEGWDGDFDNGVGNLVDGAFLNKSDEGGMSVPNSASGNVNSVGTPYFYWRWGPGESVFSPLKQVPSAVMFGSLPTGVKRTQAAYADGGTMSNAKPWRTLNFCPNPLKEEKHFGWAALPRDYLLLDLFTMPVVEPYPISEPFSTAGRLNMNYQMVPFSYIKRQTALYALFKANRVMAIANEYAGIYKVYSSSGGKNDYQIRYEIEAAETLKQFQERFDDGDIFRSAAEICSIFLVPQGTTRDDVKGWWKGYQLTGNNSRERPYAVMYPLLTTKSNVYTTYVRAQAIKVTPDGGVVAQSEYRGSATFERYVDSQNSEISAGENIDPDKNSLEPYYRFRTLSTKQFDP